MTQNEQDIQEEQTETMETSLTTRTRDEGFWKEMWQQVRLVWYLLRDPEVPIFLKLLPLAAVIYILIPTDLIPDVFPVIGQLDDITALLVGGKVFIELAPQHVVARHVEAMRRHVQSMESAAADKESSSTDLEDAIIIEGDFQEIEEETRDQAS